MEDEGEEVVVVKAQDKMKNKIRGMDRGFFETLYQLQRSLIVE
jgi:hypothetical protein